MKEMNLLENQLRSWQPRRPSARLKRRIFAAPPVSPRVVVWSLRCLAPATACLLAALAVLSHGGYIPSTTGRSGFLVATTGSNQIAYWPGNYQQEQNGYSPVALEWTNRSGPTSSFNSFSPRGLN